jgi:hypothetical protein
MSGSDDIARVARLRGKNPANYAESAQVSNAVLAMQIGVQRLHHLFYLSHDAYTDLLYYDALPKESRAFIRDCPVAINAILYADLLVEAGHQAPLIGLIREIIPHRVREVQSKRYGPKHPEAGEVA